MSENDDGREGWRYSAVGIEFTIVFLAFVLGGYWLDHRFKVLPANTILGTCVGFGLALWRLLSRVKRLKSRREDQDSNDSADDNHN